VNWINLEVCTLRAEEYIGAEPLARATWLNVLAWCCEQENGGRIVNAATWGDRRWQQTCGVTKAEVFSAAPLLVWDGEDVVVWNYPKDKEEQVRHNRNVGAKGGKATTQAKTEAARTNGAKRNPSTDPSTDPSTSQATTQATTQALTEAPTQANTQAEPKQPAQRKGKEGKGIGKEEEEEEKMVAAVAAPAPSSSDWLPALIASDAYRGIDVQREFAKCREWCSVRNKQVSRRRFLAWLNRVDAPLFTTAQATPEENGRLYAGMNLAQMRAAGVA